MAFCCAMRISSHSVSPPLTAKFGDLTEIEMKGWSRLGSPRSQSILDGIKHMRALWMRLALEGLLSGIKVFVVVLFVQTYWLAGGMRNEAKEG